MLVLVRYGVRLYSLPQNPMFNFDTREASVSEKRVT